MNGCRDKRFERMLLAYELDILPEDQRDELEQHLMECSHCYQLMQEMDKPTMMIRHDPLVRSTIIQLAGDESIRQSSFNQFRALIGRFWPRKVIATAVVILLVVVFWSWDIDFHPYKPVKAADNRLAVMNVENLSDPSDSNYVGQVLTSLIITDLSQSDFLQVVPGEYQSDILRRLEKGEVKVSDKETAKEVARMASARWVFLGSLATEQDAYKVEGKLVDMSSGEVMDTKVVKGRPGGDIFELADKLARVIRIGLPFTDKLSKEPDPVIADITTNSPEAYRYFLIGTNRYSRFYFSDAIEAFKKALEYDSTFAIVYNYLAMSAGRTQGRINREYIDLAVRYADKASKRERLYIYATKAIEEGDIEQAERIFNELLRRFPQEKLGHYQLGVAYFEHGRLEKAIGSFKMAIQLDPYYKEAYNYLAYCYAFLKDFENSLLAINTYIATAPDEPNPYDTKGDIYSIQGHLDKAIESYKAALKRNPEFHGSQIGLASIYIHSGNYAEAERLLEHGQNAELPTYRFRARLLRAVVQVRKGRFEDALHVLDHEIKRDSTDSPWLFSSRKCFLQAQLLNIMGQHDSSAALLNYMLTKYKSPLSLNKNDHYLLYFQALVKSGRIEEAKKKKELFLRDSPGIRNSEMIEACLDASLAMEQKDWPEAVESLKRLQKIHPAYIINYFLGKAYLESGEFAQAVNLLQALLSNYELGSHYVAPFDILCHYQLGRAYEQSRWYHQANEEYKKFISFWGDADIPLPEVKEAGRQLRYLRQFL